MTPVPTTAAAHLGLCGKRNRAGRFCGEPAGHTHLHAYRLYADPNCTTCEGTGSAPCPGGCGRAIPHLEACSCPRTGGEGG